VSAERIELNGGKPDPAALAWLAQVNYGHFTTLQVQQRSARGFRLHLQRLVGATRELFGAELDLEQVRAHVRNVLSDQPATVRITVFSLQLDRNRLERPVEVDILVAASAPAAAATAPLRLRSCQHERVLARVKHVGTFDLWHRRRQARLEGFDDALFCTRDGEICEGSTWNIGFWDGSRVTWPSAPALAGVTRQVLSAGLAEAGIESASVPVRLDDLDRFRSAFIANTGSVGPLVACIDERGFELDADLPQQVRAAYLSQALEPI
jgi:branched-subunit amino acid aminotransferase/4-amino-4-deoxychorismate lyase